MLSSDVRAGRSNPLLPQFPEHAAVPGDTPSDHPSSETRHPTFPRTLETARRAATRLVSLANFQPIPLFTKPTPRVLARPLKTRAEPRRARTRAGALLRHKSLTAIAHQALRPLPAIASKGLATASTNETHQPSSPL